MFGLFQGWEMARQAKAMRKDAERREAAEHAVAAEEAIRRNDAATYAALLNRIGLAPGRYSTTPAGLIEYRDPSGALQTRRAMTSFDRDLLKAYRARYDKVTYDAAPEID